MTIRFLDAAGLPCSIYAVECDGRTYRPEEIEQAIGLVWPPGFGPSRCALCGIPITQPPRGRKRKYCDACAARLGHQTPAILAGRMARKSVPGEN